MNSLFLSLRTLPNLPGVYQFYDINGKILYVGKAKNLKKRVSSYLSNKYHSGKTKLMVCKINSIKTIVVKNEYDALLLENNLIKEHKPKYNVLLRDDKTYPWICIKKERFPRIFSTRKVIRDGSEYYGPYASVKAIDTILKFIFDSYKIRTCKYDLQQKKIELKKYKVCLDYHIGNCLGPCESLQSDEDYMIQIKEIKQLIQGNFTDVIQSKQKKMYELAKEVKFEEAQVIKEQIENLQKYREKSTIINPKITNVDIFSIVSDNDYGYVNYLKVSNGAIVQSLNLEISKILDENDENLLIHAIFRIRNSWKSNSKEIFVSIPINLQIPGIQIIVPKIGDKRKIIDLSERNAKQFRLEQYKISKISYPERHTKRLLQTIKEDLNLKCEPIHIECFDNSNIQGSYPVSSCVVFKNGKPSKKDYRKYKIRTVVGSDDFKTMEEVVFRRYSRLKNEGLKFPQLIVIDGGKGQLTSALRSLKRLNLEKNISIISIAKKKEEIYFPNSPIPLYLDKKSETLKIIQQLRNEAHRFGISFHRNLRTKKGLMSELETIPGVGEKTMIYLISQFKSIKRLRKAKLSDLTKTIGPKRGKIIFDYFNEK